MKWSPRTPPQTPNMADRRHPVCGNAQTPRCAHSFPKRGRSARASPRNSGRRRKPPVADGTVTDGQGPHWYSLARQPEALGGGAGKAEAPVAAQDDRKNGRGATFLEDDGRTQLFQTSACRAAIRARRAPPSYRAELASFDEGSQSIPGVFAVGTRRQFSARRGARRAGDLGRPGPSRLREMERDAGSSAAHSRPLRSSSAIPARDSVITKDPRSLRRRLSHPRRPIAPVPGTFFLAPSFAVAQVRTASTASYHSQGCSATQRDREVLCCRCDVPARTSKARAATPNGADASRSTRYSCARDRAGRESAVYREDNSAGPYGSAMVMKDAGPPRRSENMVDWRTNLEPPSLYRREHPGAISRRLAHRKSGEARRAQHIPQPLSLPTATQCRF